MLRLLRGAGIETVYVGGCVRDGLLGTWPADFDMLIAAPLPDAQALLSAAGFPSNILASWLGPVRTLVRGEQFDLIHAWPGCPTLSFAQSVDWYVDQADFTINAMYLTTEGGLTDRHGGAADLDAGIVRFMGDPCEALRANIRQIVRYFRFLAWYGKGTPHGPSLEAAIADARHMADTDSERARNEAIKLLSAPRPYDVLSLMHQRGVLKYALGVAIEGTDWLERLARIERILGVPSGWQVRLGALLLSACMSPDAALEHVVQYWQLEPKHAERVALIVDYALCLDPTAAEPAPGAPDHIPDAAVLRDALLLRWLYEADSEAVIPHYMRALAAIQVAPDM
ncbi:CCA-adding enzyme [Phycisphaerae bacterium RAS1]|nr:CCA-adding enzyme [Phycisphaerae bacterium RAS1]